MGLECCRTAKGCFEALERPDRVFQGLQDLSVGAEGFGVKDLGCRASQRSSGVCLCVV